MRFFVQSKIFSIVNRPVASSTSAGHLTSTGGSHENRSAKGATIKALKVGHWTGVPLPNRLTAGADPGVAIGGI